MTNIGLRFNCPATRVGESKCRLGLPPVFGRQVLASVILLLLAITGSFPVTGKAQDDEKIRCVIIELYVSDQDKKSDIAIKAARELAKSRPGIRLAIRKLDASDRNQQRLKKIADFFKFDPSATPVIYCCNQVIQSVEELEACKKKLEAALRMEVFKREGCPHCADAKKYLARITDTYPGFQIEFRDILNEPDARTELNRLVTKHRTAAVSTPVFHFCDSLMVGFDRDATTGKRIEQKLNQWTIDCKKTQPKVPAKANPAGKDAKVESSNALAPEVAILPF